MKKSLVTWVLLAAVSFSIGLAFRAMSSPVYAPFTKTGVHGSEYYESALDILVSPAPDYGYFGGSDGFRVSEPVCWLVLTVKNAGTSSAALNGATLQLKSHALGDWYDYLSGTDWDTATTNMPFCTTTGPQEVDVGEQAVGIAKLYGAYAWRLRCSTASDTADVGVIGRIVTYTSGGWD